MDFIGFGWCSLEKSKNWKELHPYAKVLAMLAFDSYSQSKRSPRTLSRHRPCKTTFPIGNATFNKLPRFYLKWVFLINSQWNAGFIQPFLPRTAESASSPSIVATATAEPGSPTNFAPISFPAWNSNIWTPLNVLKGGGIIDLGFPTIPRKHWIAAT